MTEPGRRRREPLVVATANPGKLGEIRAILADVEIELRSLDQVPGVRLPEEGDDYEANAVAKARAAAAAAGLPALADDSGLEVEALDGAPGPHSARFGGSGLRDSERVELLLERVRGLPPQERGARFVCLAALATPDGRVWVARGECPGRILEAPRGDRGFGYDPVFAPEGRTCSMAELDPAAKNRISHRARALRGLAGPLEALVPGRSGVTPRSGGASRGRTSAGARRGSDRGP